MSLLSACTLRFWAGESRRIVQVQAALLQVRQRSLHLVCMAVCMAAVDQCNSALHRYSPEPLTRFFLSRLFLSPTLWHSSQLEQNSRAESSALLM